MAQRISRGSCRLASEVRTFVVAQLSDSTPVRSVATIGPPYLSALVRARDLFAGFLRQFRATLDRDCFRPAAECTGPRRPLYGAIRFPQSSEHGRHCGDRTRRCALPATTAARDAESSPCPDLVERFRSGMRSPGSLCRPPWIHRGIDAGRGIAGSREFCRERLGDSRIVAKTPLLTAESRRRQTK